VATTFKVDEDLSEELAELLRSAGFNATSIPSQGWKGRKDAKLWPDVQSEGRAFVTGDKGFSKRAAQPPHHGVVLLRPERESRKAFLRLMRRAIDSGLLNNLGNTLIVVTETRIRTRRMS
jgi:predicted nuclease of predicted toxin-antitoxin system